VVLKVKHPQLAPMEEGLIKTIPAESDEQDANG
jgi:hypothetical protein